MSMCQPTLFEGVKCLVSDALYASASSGAWLDLPQAFDEELIEIHLIEGEVGMPVAIWAYPNHVAGTVGTAVGEAVYVVTLNVETAISTFERSWTSAVFAMPTCAGQDVIPDVAATGENASLYWHAFWGWFCCLKGTASKLFKVDLCIRQNRLDMFDIDCHVTNAPQFEDDGITHFVVTIGRAFVVVTLVDHFAVIAQAAGDRRKKVDGFTILPRVDNGSVPGLHLHGADLSLTEILEDTISSPSISIAVLATFFAADNEDDWGVRRSDDAAPLLSIIDAVDIRHAVVDLANVKGHGVLTNMMSALIGCIRFCDVKEAS